MREKLIELITQYIEIEPENVTDDARFMEDIGFNSYDFISMLGDCEDVFDVEIEESEAAKSKTVGELLAYLGGLG